MRKRFHVLLPGSSGHRVAAHPSSGVPAPENGRIGSGVTMEMNAPTEDTDALAGALSAAPLAITENHVPELGPHAAAPPRHDDQHWRRYPVACGIPIPVSGLSGVDSGAASRHRGKSIQLHGQGPSRGAASARPGSRGRQPGPVFPEGTFTPPTALQSFHMGGFQLAAAARPRATAGRTRVAQCSRITATVQPTAKMGMGS